MNEQEFQQAIASEIDKANTLRQEIAQINQEREYWQQVRIQAAIAAMAIVADEDYSVRNEQHLIAKYAVQLADELIAELQKKGGQDE